jgi:hypothetical protein
MKPVTVTTSNIVLAAPAPPLGDQRPHIDERQRAVFPAPSLRGPHGHRAPHARPRLEPAHTLKGVLLRGAAARPPRRVHRHRVGEPHVLRGRAEGRIVRCGALAARGLARAPRAERLGGEQHPLRVRGELDRGGRSEGGVPRREQRVCGPSVLGARPARCGERLRLGAPCEDLPNDDSWDVLRRRRRDVHWLRVVLEGVDSVLDLARRPRRDFRDFGISLVRASRPPCACPIKAI